MRVAAALMQAASEPSGAVCGLNERVDAFPIAYLRSFSQEKVIPIRQIDL
jgi:hypothetical protein